MSMKLRERITGFVKEVALVACVVLLINSFVMASFQVPTGSMEDTVQIGDFIFVNKFIYGRVFPNPPHSKFLRSESVPRYLGSPALFPAGASYNEDNYGPIVIPRKGMKVALETESLPAWEVFIQREGHSVQTRDGKVFI